MKLKYLKFQNKTPIVKEVEIVNLIDILKFSITQNQTQDYLNSQEVKNGKVK